VEVFNASAPLIDGKASFTQVFSDQFDSYRGVDSYQEINNLIENSIREFDTVTPQYQQSQEEVQKLDRSFIGSQESLSQVDRSQKTSKQAIQEIDRSKAKSEVANKEIAKAYDSKRFDPPQKNNAAYENKPLKPTPTVPKREVVTSNPTSNSRQDLK